MRLRSRTALLSAAALVLLPALCHAQSAPAVTPENEYPQLIKTGQKISPLGPHPFGEQINLYDGTISFEVTDINVSGTGPALTLGRTLKTLEQAGYDAGGPVAWQRPFGEWDLDIPRIETNTANQANDTGWYVASNGSPGYMNRCSKFGPPPTIISDTGDFGADEYWYGYHLLIPGEGSQELLGHSAGAPHSPASGTYPIATKRDWMISCGVTATDGGEGFVALAPDGTRYTFTQLVYRSMAEVVMPWETPVYAAPNGQLTTPPTKETLARRDAVMYVTKIQDRFGNTLTYNWNANNLTSIVASDGRKVSFTYVSGTPFIHTITVEAQDTPARTWTYNYQIYSGNIPTLTSVQLPDGSAWSYQRLHLSGRPPGCDSGSTIHRGQQCAVPAHRCAGNDCFANRRDG
jgi:YD repeat-containing protein